jgi:hypothetical protein
MIDNFEDTNFMIEPLILEIYLNKNNYKDRLLINDFKKKAQIVTVPDYDSSSFFVKVHEVEEILWEKYRKDITNFDSVSPSNFQANANSIYYLEAAMREFKKLKYFRVHVSETTESSENKKFEYKIMHSRIDLANKVLPEFLVDCERIFKHIGVYQPTIYNPKPYFEVAVRDLFVRLQNYSYQLEKEDDEYLNVVNIMAAFGHKLERDNSTALVIMKK